MERNGYRDPARADKEEALEKIRTFAGCENYTFSKLSGWLYRKRNAGRGKREPAEQILYRLPVEPSLPLRLLLHTIFEHSPPDDHMIDLWDDVGTWLRNRRANNTWLPQPTMSSTGFQGFQGSQPRPYAPIKQEVPPSVPLPAIPATSYPSHWAYLPFREPLNSNYSSTPSLAIKRETGTSTPVQLHIPSSVHAEGLMRRVDDMQRMAGGNNDQRLRPRTPIREPPPRPAPYTIPLPSPPRIQRVQQQQRQHQNLEAPMFMSNAGPSTQPLRFFARDPGAPMEGRPRTARRQAPEPMSPLYSISPEQSRRSASPSPVAGQQYDSSHFSLLSPPSTPSRTGVSRY